jgi:hypothetical protein
MTNYDLPTTLLGEGMEEPIRPGYRAALDRKVAPLNQGSTEEENVIERCISFISMNR